MRPIRAVYIGKLAHLRGQGALVRRNGNHGPLLAQFDSFGAFRREYRQNQERPFSMKKHLAYGWHRFNSKDFRIDYE